MIVHRRALLSSAVALLTGPAMTRQAALTTVADYEQASGGHIGIYARNVVSGAELAWRAHDRFVMCSTVKASLAAFVLTRIDRGDDRLEAPVSFAAADIGDLYAPVAQAHLSAGVLSVRDMCKAAVEVSDGACCNLLLSRVGGPSALTAFWRSLGDTVTRLDHSEPLLNRTPPGSPQDTTTPFAMAETLQKLVLGNVLSGQSRALFLTWLLGCQTGANRLRAGLPAGWLTGDKTGHNDKDAAGDIAISWPSPHRPVVICAYTRGGAPTDAQFDAIFAGVGRLVAARLG